MKINIKEKLEYQIEESIFHFLDSLGVSYDVESYFEDD